MIGRGLNTTKSSLALQSHSEKKLSRILLDKAKNGVQIIHMGMRIMGKKSNKQPQKMTKKHLIRMMVNLFRKRK